MLICVSPMLVRTTCLVMARLNRIVSELRRISASLLLGQMRVLQVWGVGLLMPSSHNGAATRRTTQPILPTAPV
ncbi:MAG: hypothetical protein IBX58_06075 [Roseovarius sp.]|nr:hypothetical protein [Roseovarius sp.]